MIRHYFRDGEVPENYILLFTESLADVAVESIFLIALSFLAPAVESIVFTILSFFSSPFFSESLLQAVAKPATASTNKSFFICCLFFKFLKRFHLYTQNKEK